MVLGGNSSETEVEDADGLRAIRLLLLDVDGVLTDGTLQFDGEGRELKSFHVHDGSGLVYWNRTGHLSGFLSGRDSPVVRQRAHELGVHEVHLGRHDKIATYLFHSNKSQIPISASNVSDADAQLSH